MSEEQRKRNAQKMTTVALFVTGLLAVSLYNVATSHAWIHIVSATCLTLTFCLCWLRVAQLRRWL